MFQKKQQHQVNTFSMTQLTAESTKHFALATNTEKSNCSCQMPKCNKLANLKIHITHLTLVMLTC